MEAGRGCAAAGAVLAGAVRWQACVQCLTSGLCEFRGGSVLSWLVAIGTALFSHRSGTCIFSLSREIALHSKCSTLKV